MKYFQNNWYSELGQTTSTLQLDFWPRKGTSESIHFEWPGEKEISRVRICWFNGNGQGRYHLPQSWKVLYLDKDNKFKPAENNISYKVDKDSLSEVTFKPVNTTAIKIKITLHDNHSAGIREVTIE